MHAVTERCHAHAVNDGNCLDFPFVSYYIIGGLVFSPMTTGLLFAATDDFTEEG